MPKVPAILVFCAATAACGSAAQAAQRRAADTLTYEVTTKAHVTGAPVSTAAYNAQPPVVTTLTLTVSSVEANGDALVHVTSHAAAPAGYNQILRAAWEKTQDGLAFNGKLSADGALLVTLDDSYQSSMASVPTPGTSLAQQRDQIVAKGSDPAFRANTAARNAKGFFTVANVVALSAAKHRSPNVGDAWHAVIDGADYDVAVTGKEPYHGHDTVVLSVKSRSDNPGGSSTTEATANYDAQARLVIGTHAVTTFASTSGLNSTTTFDLALKE